MFFYFREIEEVSQGIPLGILPGIDPGIPPEKISDIASGDFFGIPPERFK